MKSVSSHHQYWRIFIVVSTYWVVSITTVFINKVLLSGESVKLDAPFFITWFQCFVSASFYFLYSKLFWKRTYNDHVVSPFGAAIIKSVLPLSVVFASMISFNNLCLKYVDVSFYYVGRSLTTVFNVILTYMFLRETTSLRICFCCLIIISGFWLGVDQEHFIGSFSLPGTVYGVLGSLSLAYYSIKTKSVLPVVDDMVWILSYYNNIYSCLLFVPLVIANNEIVIILNYQLLGSIYFWLLMIVSGICGLAIGYVTTLQIKVTSPLTHNISGTAKACAQTVIATFFFNEYKPLLWWLSNWIVLAGSAAYTAIRQKEMAKQRASVSLVLIK